MRPTKREMRVTPASAQATACTKLKRSVRLRWMPGDSRSSAVRIPSYVLATLDQNTIAGDTLLFIQRNQLSGLGKRTNSIKAQAGCDLGGNPARHDFENLTSEQHEKTIDELFRHAVVIAAQLGSCFGCFFDQVTISGHLGR